MKAHAKKKDRECILGAANLPNKVKDMSERSVKEGKHDTGASRITTEDLIGEEPQKDKGNNTDNENCQQQEGAKSK